ncbi:MAG TPA: Uma2 family endonuclease [Polyangiaceae bacterium]|nr:Uma2 family endonuclease [Polyangiaceae bacterium]
MSVDGERQRRTDSAGPVTIGRFRYLHAPRPLHFPEHERVPETKLHLELRTLLWHFLKLAFADTALIGCDQFVYWDAANPRASLAPDAFVRLGGRDELFGSWKVWERGAPHVAVEIISSHDARDGNWAAKLQAYRQLGVRELVRFDPEAETARLRVWDRIDNDLAERDVEGAAASNVLPGFWLEVMNPQLGPSLRLSRDQAGADLYLTPGEADAKRIEADAKRMEADAKRMEADAKRIRELEAELARRGG